MGGAPGSLPARESARADKPPVAPGADRTVRLWSVFSGQELLRLEGNTLPVCSVAFAQNGRLLASGSQSDDGFGDVFLWSAAGEETDN